MCSPSLVHPEPIRRLRNLTRYRRALVADRGREMQRAEKLLEDAQIKISSVLTEVHGVSGRRGKGNPWLGGTLGRIVFGLSRTDTFLGTRYRRLAKRRGKQKAIVALGTRYSQSSTTCSPIPRPASTTSGPASTNRGSTRTAAPATSPHSCRRSPARRSSSATERRSSPNPLPDNNIRDTGHLGLYPPSPGCVVTWPCYRGFSGRVTVWKCGIKLRHCNYVGYH